MVANYSVKGDSFEVEKPQVWSSTRVAQQTAVRHWDLASDGKRIIALMPANGPGTETLPDHVTFLENFFDELRRKVPIGK